MQPTALITGASSGIGLAFARIFAKNNYNLVLVARNEVQLNALAAELSHVTVTVIAKDLSQNNAPQAIFEALQAQHIVVNVLINNAGFGDFSLFHESNWAKQAQMIDLNIRALTELTHLFGGAMVARRSGKILNVASTAAFQPGPTMAVYYATKHYVLAFSEAISNEMAEYGVVVSCLCPGITASGFQAAAALEESRLVKGKKMPTSEEVAEYGYKALMQGKTVAIHGWLNWAMANSVRFTPRAWVLKAVRFMQNRADA